MCCAFLSRCSMCIYIYIMYRERERDKSALYAELFIGKGVYKCGAVNYVIHTLPQWLACARVHVSFLTRCVRSLFHRRVCIYVMCDCC